MKLTAIAMLAAGLALAACSDEPPEENVFEAQTEALDKAADAARQLEAAAEAQRQAIEEQSR
ncbi:MAG: hypothetical protein ACU85V_18380 [Gammaproteobacteria bacterium]